MHNAANPSVAGLKPRGGVLGPRDLRRIAALWQTAEWPGGTDAYAKAGYQRSFGYYLRRIGHLGLSGGLLIDAGCGGGRWSFAWATRFDHVIGFDVSQPRLAAANWQKDRLGIQTVEFITGNILKIPAPDDTVDALFCNDVISNHAHIEEILKEFLRVLKPGGACYLGLTGPGAAYELTKSGNPQLADLGRRRIYNTLCGRHLSSLVEAIGPGRARNTEAAACLRGGMPTRELLTSLDCRPDQIAAAEAIADDLGQEFSRILLDDLAAINTGARAWFGDRLAGRVWDVDEVYAAAGEAGFGLVERAPDGWLSLKRDGSIEKAPCDNAAPRANGFEGRVRAFEMLLWKPSTKASLENRHPDDQPVEPAGNAIPQRRSGTEWRTTLGSTTYWNVNSKKLVSPIIDSKPPVLTELEGAIITTAHWEPPGGLVRFSTGGVYDRDHNLLPSFLERESYEDLQSQYHRIKNDVILGEEKVENAPILTGKYIYLGMIWGHFGHFLLESLSHIWYLLKADRDLKVVFQQYRPIKIPSYAKYIFDLFDLDSDRILFIERTSIIEHLFFPEREFEIRWKAHPSYADTFREISERSLRLFPYPSTPRSVYFTRRLLKEDPNSPQKSIVNEADVEVLFAERGFTIVAPEKLPIHEQIAIATGADQIAGLKGSALHMSLFCQQSKARLIQISRVQAANQSLIDGLKNMESHQILCEFARMERGGVVDLEVIRAALHEM